VIRAFISFEQMRGALLVLVILKESYSPSKDINLSMTKSNDHSSVVESEHIVEAEEAG